LLNPYRFAREHLNCSRAGGWKCAVGYGGTPQVQCHVDNDYNPSTKTRPRAAARPGSRLGRPHRCTHGLRAALGASQRSPHRHACVAFGLLAPRDAASWCTTVCAPVRLPYWPFIGVIQLITKSTPGGLQHSMQKDRRKRYSVRWSLTRSGVAQDGATP
jgi:hypothetical protein